MVFRDITERRQLEEHQRQALKMEAIGRLAGGIAHDFNNFMTTIIGYSELLLQGGLPTEAGHEFCEQINTAGQRAATITRQILAFSRKQMFMPCVLSLNAIIQDMSDMVRRLIGQQIEFIALSGSGPSRGEGRSDANRPGAAQPGHECPRRHAFRRQTGRRHVEQIFRRGDDLAPTPT